MKSTISTQPEFRYPCILKNTRLESDERQYVLCTGLGDPAATIKNATMLEDTTCRFKNTGNLININPFFGWELHTDPVLLNGGNSSDNLYINISTGTVYLIGERDRSGEDMFDEDELGPPVYEATVVYSNKPETIGNVSWDTLDKLTKTDIKVTLEN